MGEKNCWWIKIMQYIRETPGRLYEDQLERMFKSELDKHNFQRKNMTIVDFLNSSHCWGKGGYLKMDPATRGIYTVPSRRGDLDKLIYEATEHKYRYNRYLYQDKRIIYLGKAQKMDAFVNNKEVVFFNNQSKELSIDLTRLKVDGENVVVQDFDINQIIEMLFCGKASKDRKKFHFGKIDASGVIFRGDTCLYLKEGTDLGGLTHFKNGMCFNGATFCGNLDAGNMVFNFNADNAGEASNRYNKVDFRNVRFFGDVTFRDIQFCGDAPNMEISFEDARIQDSLQFINVNFGHAAVTLFQMVIGNFIWGVEKEGKDDKKKSKHRKNHKLYFKNVFFADDSSIDLTDAEMTDTDIEFENVPALPITKICLAPIHYAGTDEAEDKCPNNYLLIKNCEIHKTLYIGNVSALSFCDSRNYGDIVEAPNWSTVTDTEQSGRKRRIATPILWAVYNNKRIEVYKEKYTEAHMEKCKDDNFDNLLCYTKAEDFVMLAENFKNQGKYDEQDEAFILHMEFKPYINYIRRKKTSKTSTVPKSDWLTKSLYRVLYLVGKYGISPLRVIVSLFVTIPVFAGVYYIFAGVLGCAAFKIGNWTLQSGDWAGNILPSILYSIGNIIPFASQFQPINIWVCVCTILESFIGSFLIGYFSVAVVRKTLR